MHYAIYKYKTRWYPGGEVLCFFEEDEPTKISPMAHKPNKGSKWLKTDPRGTIDVGHFEEDRVDLVKNTALSILTACALTG